jgi:hypothetical protein
MVYTQKLSNHLALIVPRNLGYTSLSDVGNEDSPDKKARDQDILDTALPDQSHFLCTREPMLNYADSELCGKWKVLPNVTLVDIRFLKSYCSIGFVREVRFSFFHIQYDF